MDLQSLNLELDILNYVIRSADVLLTKSSVEKKILETKEKIKNIDPLFQVLESYFIRNNISKETKSLYYQKELDKNLNALRKFTSEIVKCHQALNYPLPDWLMSKVVLAEDTEDPELQFEIKLFNWITAVKHEQGDMRKLLDLKEREGFQDLNMAVAPNQQLHGFLTFDVIADKWQYRDLRIHRKIDTVVKREWSKLLGDLIIKVEFMTGKIGIIMVLSRKELQNKFH